MAVAHRISTSTSATAAGSYVTAALAGAVAGDLLLLRIFITLGNTVTTPGAGWTLQRSSLYQGMQVYVYYRTTADPGTTFTFNTNVNYQVTYSAFSSCSGIQTDVVTTGTTDTQGVLGSQTGSLTLTGPTATTKNTTSVLALAAAVIGTFPTSMPGFTLLGTDFGISSTFYKNVPNATAAALGNVSATFQNGPNVSAQGDYLVLTAANVAPLAATLNAPAANTYQDLGAGFTFAWTFNTGLSPQDDTQQSYALRRKIGAGAYEYWNVSTVAWQAAEVFNTSSVSSVTFAAAKWTNGNTYVWSVNTTASNTLTGTYPPDQAVVANNSATVGLTAPVGAVITNRPTVTWTFAGGTAQAASRTLIYPLSVTQAAGFMALQGTGAVMDVSRSGVGTSAVTPVDLTNGSTFVAYVQVAGATPARRATLRTCRPS